MAIAITLKEYLSNNRLDYNVITHRHTETSYNTGVTAHLPLSQVSKAVVLQNEQGQHLMAVLQANRKLKLEEVNRLTGSQYRIIEEHELKDLFQDCEEGAIPGLGDAYRMHMMVDNNLLTAKQIYVEAGDHEHLLEFERKQYADMMFDIPHGEIGGQVISQPRENTMNWEI